MMTKQMLSAFLKDKQGNIAIFAAFALLPIILAAGVAVDFSNISRAESAYQQALDSAVLAAAQKESLDEANYIAQKVLHAHYPTLDSPKVTFTNSTKGIEVTATLKAKVNNAFMGIAGNPTTTIGLESVALSPRKLTSARFKPINARGLFDKTVHLKVKQKGASRYKNKVSIHYRSGYYHPGRYYNASTTSWVDLGDYEHAYIEFRIDQYRGRPVAYSWRPLVVRSDDPNFSHRFYIDGVNQPRGIKFSIFDLIPCGKSRLAWEDYSLRLFPPDVTFEVEGKCEKVATDKIRLIK